MIGRFALPLVAGRGAVLGNELVPWARAFLAAQVGGARCLPPSFGLNARRYWRHFGTSRLDWIGHRALCASLPRVHFGEEDYLAHGGGDAVQALGRFVAAHRLAERPFWVLTTDGMWGGLRHIEAARDFAFTTLHASRFAAGNLVRIWQRIDPALPVVGLHVRMGDFGEPVSPGAYQGRFNISLPPEWYQQLALSIHEQMAGRVQFLIVSDAPVDRLQFLARGIRSVFTGDIPDSDCSDLLALARCDLLVCAVSSYSVWAAFLSDAPYLWYGPNLTPHEGGWGSIWGHEAGQRRPGSPTRDALAHAHAAGPGLPTRAWAVAASGVVPFAALEMARERHARRSTDLVRYGVARMPMHEELPV